MGAFLQQIYYGNTVGEWALALGIIVVSVIVGRIVYWLISRGIKGLTRRSKTVFDDSMVDMLEEPAVGLMVLVGVRYALSTLKCPMESAHSSVAHSIWPSPCSSAG